MLRPQDILVVLKLAVHEDEVWTYDGLGAELGLSASGVHAAVARARTCGFLDPHPIRPALLEFLVHGLRYVFPPVIGRRRRGMPTGASAEPLVRYLASTQSSALVWPDPHGQVRGESLVPLYKTVPMAASIDAELYALLGVVDAIRVGGARVREVAEDVLVEMLS